MRHPGEQESTCCNRRFHTTSSARRDRRSLPSFRHRLSRQTSPNIASSGCLRWELPRSSEETRGLVYQQRLEAGSGRGTAEFPIAELARQQRISESRTVSLVSRPDRKIPTLAAKDAARMGHPYGYCQTATPSPGPAWRWRLSGSRRCSRRSPGSPESRTSRLSRSNCDEWRS